MFRKHPGWPYSKSSVEKIQKEKSNHSEAATLEVRLEAVRTAGMIVSWRGVKMSDGKRMRLRMRREMAKTRGAS